MKNASEYARRARRLVATLKLPGERAVAPSLDSITDHLIVALLMRHGSDAEAMAAYRQLRASTVDLNELRVTPAEEMAEIIGAAFANVRVACDGLARVLVALFNRSHHLDLEFLTKLPRKEARAWLQSLDGMDAFTISMVLLRGLKEPAFPVDDGVLALLKSKDVVPETATHADAAAVMERVVSQSNIEPVMAALRALAQAHAAARKPAGRSPAIRSSKRVSNAMKTARPTGASQRKMAAVPTARPKTVAAGGRARARKTNKRATRSR